MSSFLVDSPVRHKIQGLLSFQSLKQFCGICDLGFKGERSKEHIFDHISAAMLRTDGRTLDALQAGGVNPSFPDHLEPYVEHLPSFDGNLQVVVGELHTQILGTLRKALNLLVKRHMSISASSSESLKERVRRFDEAIRDVDRACTWTASLRALHSAVRFFNGVLTKRFVERFLFSFPELIDVEVSSEGKDTLRLACRGLVQFVHGIRYAQQIPQTSRSRAQAELLMESALRLLDQAFPPCHKTRKGTGANGMRSALPHGNMHVFVLMSLLGPSSFPDDAPAEARHQGMKASSSNTNRGHLTSWAETMFKDLHIRHALALCWSEGRYGFQFEFPLGMSVREKITEATPLAGDLIHCSPSYYSAVEVVTRSSDDTTPRPVDRECPLPPAGYVAALPCWCCPSWQHTIPLVVQRRAVRVGTDHPYIGFTYGFGGLPSQRLLAGLEASSNVLASSRRTLLNKAFSAAFPLAPIPTSSDWHVYGAAKLPGGLTVHVGDWVLMDRHALFQFMNLVGDASDQIAELAAAQLDPRIAVLEDYAYWPERFAACRIRAIVDVVIDGIHHTFVDPVYYEFVVGTESSPSDVNVLPFVRDTAGAKKCTVGTECWVLKKWDGEDGAATDETLFPLGMIRVVPNVVHKCVAACKPGPACIHRVHAKQTILLNSLDTHDCRCCRAKQSVTRIVHSCPPSTSEWLLSAFDMDKSGYVKW